jgi:hypothetical protein
MNEFTNLFVEQTSKTPQVDLNQYNGELILYGRSIPENAAKVYEPVLTWVAQYVKNPKATTNFRINLEYFNTSSSIWIVKIIKALMQIKDPDFVLILHIYIPIDDFEEMEQSGDLKEAFSPISDILTDAIVSVGIKVYALADGEKIVKEKLIFV